jgi:hypothetical protein
MRLATIMEKKATSNQIYMTDDVTVYYWFDIGNELKRNQNKLFVYHLMTFRFPYINDVLFLLLQILALNCIIAPFLGSNFSE